MNLLLAAANACVNWAYHISYANSQIVFPYHLHQFGLPCDCTFDIVCQKLIELQFSNNSLFVNKAQRRALIGESDIAGRHALRLIEGGWLDMVCDLHGILSGTRATSTTTKKPYSSWKMRAFTVVGSRTGSDWSQLVPAKANEARHTP